MWSCCPLFIGNQVCSCRIVNTGSESDAKQMACAPNWPDASISGIDIFMRPRAASLSSKSMSHAILASERGCTLMGAMVVLNGDASLPGRHVAGGKLSAENPLYVSEGSGGGSC